MPNSAPNGVVIGVIGSFRGSKRKVSKKGAFLEAREDQRSTAIRILVT
jgi:hypothetical protein